MTEVTASSVLCCAVCGSTRRVEGHHICKADNIRSALISLCHKCHFRVGRQLDRYRVPPLPGRPKAELQPAASGAALVWSFACGGILTLADWAENIGEDHLAREDFRSLTNIARLATVLGGRDIRFGVSPAENLATERKVAAKAKHNKRNQGTSRIPLALTPAFVLRFGAQFLSALGAAITELLKDSEQDKAFVQWLTDLPLGEDGLLGAFMKLESHPRVGELVRICQADVALFHRLPAAMLGIIRAKIAGNTPDPADYDVLERFAVVEPVRRKLLDSLAHTKSDAELDEVIRRYLDIEIQPEA